MGVLAVCDAKLCTQTSLRMVSSGVTGRRVEWWAGGGRAGFRSVRVVAHCAASARRVARRIWLLMKRFVQICY